MKAEYETKIFAAELGDAETIDLHGMRVDEAMDELNQFLQSMFMRGERVLRIIHGGGTQSLKQAVSKTLKQERIVEYFRGSSLAHEMGAVTYVILARNK